MKRPGLIQANTEKLILHVRIATLQVTYDVNVWTKLVTVFTIDRMYDCKNGVCHLDSTTTSAITSMKPKTVKAWKKTTFVTRPGCFTTTELPTVISTSLKFTCSTEINIEESRFILPVWKIYVPIVCVVSMIVLLAILYIVKRRQHSNSSHDDQSDSATSMSMFDVQGISPVSPAIMESSLNSPCSSNEEHTYVAQRTRSKCEPIAHRLRSKRKDS